MSMFKNAKSGGSRGLIALSLLLAGLSACGQANFVDVTVTIKKGVVAADKLTQIDRCNVTVSGAESDSFGLTNCSDARAATSTLLFQYGSEKDSGTLNFVVDILSGIDSNAGPTGRRKLGTGSGSGSIKSGSRATVSIEVVPDPAMYQ